MPLAEIQNERIVVGAEYREREMVKLIPGSRWDSEAGTWSVPLSWAACCQLRGIFGARLEVGPALIAWSREDRVTRRDPCLALREAEDSEDLSFMTALRPFQRAGARFLSVARHALLADEMGLGKTIQAIAALEAIGNDAYPALVVCPNSMKRTWADEFNRWAPGRDVVVVSGSAPTRKKAIALLGNGEADVAVINYEGLRAHTRLEGYGSMTLSVEEKRPKELNEAPIRTVIADESHRAKDPRAKQTRALWAISRDATYRFALTGTPIANSPEDMWSLMRFVAPTEFPTKTKFIDRYAQQDFNVYGFMQVTGLVGENKDELFRIIDPRFMRRTKAAVLSQLPAKIYAVRYCEMVPKQKKAYEEMRKEQYAQLENGVLLATNPLTKMTRLLQFASAFGELDGEKLILTEPSCKIDALEEIVAELGAQQAVVFAQSKQLVNLGCARLLKAGYRVASITGDILEHDRAIAVRDFQERKLKVLLLTLGAGGEGLTLTAASTAVFLQRSWSHVQNVQAEDRIHRIGQEDAVTIVDVITQGTAEERVHASGAYKAYMAEQVTRDADTLKRWLAK